MAGECPFCGARGVEVVRVGSQLLVRFCSACSSLSAGVSYEELHRIPDVRFIAKVGVK